ncbi:MAG: carbon storage regulator CsrA [Bacillota bacterium]|nr:carbon storage regulator CsrA [Bacillota bacterium]
MLVITRKKDESFLIGDDIEIKIIETEDGRVKIGIEAPKDKRIVRKEILEEVTDTNKKSVFDMNSKELADFFKDKIK